MLLGIAGGSEIGFGGGLLRGMRVGGEVGFVEGILLGIDDGC